MAKKPEKDIQYGTENLLDHDDLDLKKSKIRVTTMIDFPVVESLKEEAEGLGIGYQTLINMVLNTYVKGRDREINRIESRLNAFEGNYFSMTTSPSISKCTTVKRDPVTGAFETMLENAIEKALRDLQKVEEKKKA